MSTSLENPASETPASKESKLEDETPAIETKIESFKLAESCLEGQVSCVDGPMANAVVSIAMNNTYTDSKGNFLLEHVKPGIVKLRVKSSTTRFYNYEQDILIEDGKKKEGLFIFLSEVTGAVEGVVTGEDGKIIVGAELSGLFRLAKDALTSKTDEKGHYEFKDVPRGAYYLRVRAPGFMTEGASVDVIGARTTVCNFNLKPGSLSITGKLVTSAGEPIVEGDMYLIRKGVVAVHMQVSASMNGVFAFNDLVSDTYEINVMAPGYLAKGWRGKVEKNETVNFQLDPLPPSTSSDQSQM